MVDVSEAPEHETEFDPCDTPRGMSYYKLDDLTASQQSSLNNDKINVVRENHRYLQNHPEITLVVQLVLKEVLKARPVIKIQRFLAEYFTVHWKEIEEKMLAAARDTTSTEEVVEFVEDLEEITPKPSDEFSLQEIPMSWRESMTDTTSMLNRVSVGMATTPSGICAAIVEDIVDKAERQLRAKETIELAFRGKSDDSDPMLDLDDDSEDSLVTSDNKDAEAPTDQ